MSRGSEKIRRTITVSVCLPVTCVVEVERPADEEYEDDWQIVSVQRLDCSASASFISEQMAEEDHAEMIKRANAAKDDE